MSATHPKTEQLSVKTDRKGKVQIPDQVSVWIVKNITYDQAVHAPYKMIDVVFEQAIPLVESKHVFPLERNFWNYAAILEIRKIQNLGFDFNHSLQSEVEAGQHFARGNITPEMMGKVVSEMFDLIRSIIELYRELPDSIVMRFGGELARNLRGSAKIHLDKIQQYEKILRNPGTNAGDLFDILPGMRRDYHEAFSSLENHIAYALLGRDWEKDIEQKIAPRLDKIVEKAKQVEQKIEEEFAAQKNLRDSFEKGMKDYYEKAETVLKSIQATAAEAGIGKHADFFANASKRHEELADKWYVFARRAIFALMAWVAFSVFFQEIPWVDAVAAHPNFLFYNIIASKILITSALAVWFAFCVKNYLAHKHNAVVNKHRDNALRTYRALVESPSSQEIRDTVLNHAAACIYTPEDSGYIKNSGKAQVIPMPSILRQISDKIQGSE